MNIQKIEAISEKAKNAKIKKEKREIAKSKKAMQFTEENKKAEKEKIEHLAKLEAKKQMLKKLAFEKSQNFDLRMSETYNFSLSLYQMDSLEKLNTFEYKVSGNFDENLPKSELSKIVSEKIFVIVNAQTNIKLGANKTRMFKLAQGKNLFIKIRHKGLVLVDTILEQSIKMKLILGHLTQNEFAVIVHQMLNVISASVAMPTQKSA